MKFDEIRIYSEVLEQGVDFKEYIKEISLDIKCINIYTKKARGEIVQSDSLITRIRKSKDVDVFLTAISNGLEYPLLMVEYSTAVPTDDHKMQRSDVYFWSAAYKVAMMKIYPSSKGMSQDFGGGDKFTDEAESVIAFNRGGLFYPIHWETISNTEILRTKENALSCIHYSSEIHNILLDIIHSFGNQDTLEGFFDNLRICYKEKNEFLFQKWTTEKLKSLITNSSRFRWQNNRLVSKINRFGHAMDPDRGVLYFTSMLNGKENCVTEIQINRTSVDGRGGYRSLFDACARESLLRKYVDTLIKTKNNVFSAEDMLYVFSYALCVEQFDLFTKISNNEYEITDEKLRTFLINCSSMTSKCIFFLSTELILTDANRNTVCKINWNASIIDEYFNTLFSTNLQPTPIRPLTKQDVKEDIVTYASCELYKQLDCSLLAVSYPGAQGDRCVLKGEGRTVLRTYIDIIALKKDVRNSILLLEECKDSISKSISDVNKLSSLIRDKEQLKGLKLLVRNIADCDSIDDIKISIGAKYSPTVPFMDIDYLFMFSIRPESKHTVIDYSIAIIDTSLIELFSKLSNSGKLKGSLVLEQLFTII